IPVMALWGLYGPAAQALMSRRVGSHEQGRLQGANSSVMALTGLVGPGLFTLTFAHFNAQGRSFALPGAPFYLAARVLAAAALLALRLARPVSRDPGDEAPKEARQPEIVH